MHAHTATPLDAYMYTNKQEYTVHYNAHSHQCMAVFYAETRPPVLWTGKT